MGNMSITARISSVPKGIHIHKSNERKEEKNAKFTLKDVYMLVVALFIDIWLIIVVFLSNEEEKKITF